MPLFPALAVHCTALLSRIRITSNQAVPQTFIRIETPQNAELQTHWIYKSDLKSVCVAFASPAQETGSLPKQHRVLIKLLILAEPGKGSAAEDGQMVTWLSSAQTRAGFAPVGFMKLFQYLEMQTGIQQDAKDQLVPDCRVHGCSGCVGVVQQRQTAA